MVAGRIHSIETLSTADGPGLRCVVFLQGCPLRCLYCQNPDTQPGGGGEVVRAEELVARIARVAGYLGRRGGVTCSGGEPLAQPAFVADVLRRCRAAGLHTAIDTAGPAINPAVEAALAEADLLLLDVKHTDPARHVELTGAPLAGPLAMLDHAARIGLDTWVRQVIVPGWNDSPPDMDALAALLAGRANVRRVELLGYHKLAAHKYDALGRPDPLADTPAADAPTLARCRTRLAERLARTSIEVR